MKKIQSALSIVGLFVAVQGLADADCRPEWEDLAVNSVNRLPPRTYAMPLADEQAALSDALEPETPYVKSLNGVWKFSWAGNPQLRVKDFWKADFDDRDWLTIDVPSCVELRGFGAPGYTNVRYPHAYDPKRDTQAPTIRDRDTDKPDYNPVSSYRTTFTVPENWKDRDVILRFDGVYSAYYVWVNGQRVGYAEDSKLPSEFDITPYLGHPATSHQPPATNSLCVEVYRWSDGSFLEDQDMTRYSGIFRDVTLWARPKDGIWDFAVRTTPDGGYERWKVEVEGVEGASVSLYDADKKKVCDLRSTPTPNTYTFTLAARAWSPEDPYLYTLVLKKGDDIRRKRIGFKEQKIVGHTFLVNGKPVKFKGVNRHECSPENGRTVSLEEMTADITLMKRYNVNAVRTCHYPDHRLWYDLCDRYGLYVIAEANVEGHEPNYGENGLGRHPEWAHAIVERNVRHALFYRNNPCVTMWSMGNETGHGDCFRQAIAEVRKTDPSRPIHWERGNADADVDSRMYPSVEWLDKRGQFGDSGVGALKKEDGGIGFSDAGDHTAGKCAFLCEYAHAMGNAIGNFQEYWDVFYRYESLCGGCIWDWVDQAVWKDTDRVDPKTGARVRYLAYGGDFDEEPNDGPFNCNGVIDPLRRVSAKLVEVGHVHRNLVLTGDGEGSFTLENRFLFTDASDFDCRWELVEDGEVVREGDYDVPSVPPLSRTTEAFDLSELGLRAGHEYFLNVSFMTRRDSLWAKAGWVMSRNQVRLGNEELGMKNEDWLKKSPFVPVELKVVEDAKTVRVTAGGTTAVFCRKTGTLCALEMNGKTVLRDPAPGISSGPLLTCGRAFTDNDRWARDGDAWRENRKVGGFYSRGLSQLRYHAHPIAIEGKTVRIVTDVTGMKSAGFTQTSAWTFADDGAVRVENTVVPHGTMPPALARLGFSLKLDKSLENMRYYGRGPRENYIDRKSGSFLGAWTSTVTDQYEPYVRPQDNGYKCDVRWAEFTDGDGRGVRFTASEPLFVQALHYGFEDLEFARHRAGQKRFNTPLVPREEVCLNLDVRQLGLGGASCGPKPMAKYIFPIEETKWTLEMRPVKGK